VVQGERVIVMIERHQRFCVWAGVCFMRAFLIGLGGVAGCARHRPGGGVGSGPARVGAGLEAGGHLGVEREGHGCSRGRVPRGPHRRVVFTSCGSRAEATRDPPVGVTVSGFSRCPAAAGARCGSAAPAIATWR
jgi:hypothetical protein